MNREGDKNVVRGYLSDKYRLILENELTKVFRVNWMNDVMSIAINIIAIFIASLITVAATLLSSFLTVSNELKKDGSSNDTLDQLNSLSKMMFGNFSDIIIYSVLYLIFIVLIYLLLNSLRNIIKELDYATNYTIIRIIESHNYD